MNYRKKPRVVCYRGRYDVGTRTLSVLANFLATQTFALPLPPSFFAHPSELLALSPPWLPPFVFILQIFSCIVCYILTFNLQNNCPLWLSCGFYFGNSPFVVYRATTCLASKFFMLYYFHVLPRVSCVRVCLFLTWDNPVSSTPIVLFSEGFHLIVSFSQREYFSMTHRSMQSEEIGCALNYINCIGLKNLAGNLKVGQLKINTSS